MVLRVINLVVGVDGNSIVGFNLLDVETHETGVIDREAFYRELINGRIVNVDLDAKGQLIGTENDLSDFSRLDSNLRPIEDTYGIYVMNTFEGYDDYQYTTCDSRGVVNVVDRKQLIRLYHSFRIINARLSMRGTQTVIKGKLREIEDLDF